MGGEIVHIASAGNSETACLQLLLDKGYTIKDHGSDYYGKSGVEEDFPSSKSATKEGFSFIAENFMELLGLVTLGETWGDYWQENGLGKNAWDQIDYGEET